MDRSAFRVPLIERVQNGMKVVDAAGQEIGAVEYVKFGEPGAATTRGTETEPSELVGKIAETLVGEAPEMPQPLRDRLIRSGYIRIDGPDLFDTDRFVGASRIASVEDDVVRLSVTKEQLPEEIS